MSKIYINPPTLFDSKQYGFSQAVLSRSAGCPFYTSGQVAINEEQVVIGVNLSQQTRQVMRNLRFAVEAAGGKLSDVMSLRIYFVETASADLGAIGETLREFFGTDTPPTATWVGVTSLARKDFLVEIEAAGMIDCHDLKSPSK